MLKENKIRVYLHYNKSELDVLVIVYSSMYKAAKRFNLQSRLISIYDGNVWQNRYAIKVLTESN